VRAGLGAAFFAADAGAPDPPQPPAASSGNGASARSMDRRDQGRERGTSGAVTQRPYVTDSQFCGDRRSDE
jgi:hypothetical protein